LTDFACRVSWYVTIHFICLALRFLPLVRLGLVSAENNQHSIKFSHWPAVVFTPWVSSFAVSPSREAAAQSVPHFRFLLKFIRVWIQLPLPGSLCSVAIVPCWPLFFGRVEGSQQSKASFLFAPVSW
jgi:hypothetical protein